MKQNSGRAEIFAGILAVKFAWTVEIRSDYLLFTRRAQQLLDGGVVHSSWANHDLWSIFSGLLSGRESSIKVCKVEAHKDWTKLEGQAQFDCCHNAQVDREAKQVVEKQHPEIHDLHVRATRAQDAKRKLVNQIFPLWVMLQSSVLSGLCSKRIGNSLTCNVLCRLAMAFTASSQSHPVHS